MAVATASTAHAPRNVTPGLGPRPTPPLRPRAELLTVVILVVLLLIVAAFQHAIVVLALQRVQAEHDDVACGEGRRAAAPPQPQRGQAGVALQPLARLRAQPQPVLLSGVVGVHDVVGAALEDVLKAEAEEAQRGGIGVLEGRLRRVVLRSVCSTVCSVCTAAGEA